MHACCVTSISGKSSQKYRCRSMKENCSFLTTLTVHDGNEGDSTENRKNFHGKIITHICWKQNTTSRVEGMIRKAEMVHV